MPKLPLSPADEQEIIAAIRKAEQKTSGEIRVHIEANCPAKTVFERAEQLFFELKMNNTKLENGVLIYIAHEDHKFYIMGDRGIDQRVGQDFWDCTKNTMQAHFANQELKEGLIAGILQAGKQLKKFFPWQTDDINELPDEISKA